MTATQSRQFINAMAVHADEWAGIPFPVQGEQLVIHPSYKFASVLNKKPEKKETDFELVNCFHSETKPGHDFYMIRVTATGKLEAFLSPRTNRLTMEFSTFGIAAAWDLAAEQKAQQKLASLVKEHTLRHYLLTGAFIETSKRSGVTYMFRRLRPTLAIKVGPDGAKCLCGLCLHPIGYYAGTWGGCMVPTDEVVAHLILMRGDEADFWRQANQHPAYHPASGL